MQLGSGSGFKNSELQDPNPAENGPDPQPPGNTYGAAAFGLVLDCTSHRLLGSHHVRVATVAGLHPLSSWGTYHSNYLRS